MGSITVTVERKTGYNRHRLENQVMEDSYESR
jgi:hypothetical protein